MIRIFDQGGTRFVIWVGPGRDPQVAYLDARQLVLTTSELGASGLQLHDSGASYNVFGGDRRGPIEPAVMHRIVHAATDREGTALFVLDTPCRDAITDGLCETARRPPRPGTEADPPGTLVITGGSAIGWVPWGDPGRAEVLRRAVYADDRYLIEAATDPHGAVRAWPVHALGPFGLELVAPSARDLAMIEARIAEAVARPVDDPPS